MKTALFVIAAVVAAAGCDNSACRGVDGTCVALTVAGSGSVDGLEIVLSGAASGTKVVPQMAAVASLPVEVGLQLAHASSGTLHIDVAGVLLGDQVGTGSTDVPVTSGAHTHATVTLSAGGGGGSGGGDGGTPIFFDVTGTRVRHFVLGDGGVVDVASDFTSVPVSAQVPVDGGVKVIAGSGDANGNFTIHNVPSAPFYLRFDDAYVLGSSMMFDLGEWIQGRADQTAATSTTNLNVSVSNVDPWMSGDTLEFLSLNAGTAVFGVETLFNPTVTSTSIGGSIDLSRVAFGNLIDAAKGDDAFLIQLVADSDNGVPYQRLAKIANFPAFSVANGQSASLNAAMTDVPQTGSQPVAWTRSQFAQYRTAVNPNATAGADSFTVFAQPGGLAHGSFSSTPDVAIALPPAGATDVSLTMSYGNPFPSSWPLVAAARSFFTVTYTATGATATTLDGQVSAYIPVATLPSAVVPLISPVQSPTIDGMNAFAAGAGASPTPTIAWSAPAVGTPSGYTMSLFAINNSGGKTSLDRMLTMYTKLTSVTVPPGLLAGGQSYFVLITAYVDAVDRSVTPFNVALPTAYADALSGAVNVGLVAQAASCKELHAMHPDYPDGVYTIDVDGAGAASPVAVYCDMTSDGGGWTLCAWSHDPSKSNPNWASLAAAQSSNWYACHKYSPSLVEARVRVDNGATAYSNQYSNVDFRPSAGMTSYTAASGAALKLELLPGTAACGAASANNFQWDVRTTKSIYSLTPKDTCGTNMPLIFIGGTGANSNGCWGTNQVSPQIGYPCGGYGNFGVHLELWAR